MSGYQRADDVIDAADREPAYPTSTPQRGTDNLGLVNKLGMIAGVALIVIGLIMLEGAGAALQATMSTQGVLMVLIPVVLQLFWLFLPAFQQSSIQHSSKVVVVALAAIDAWWLFWSFIIFTKGSTPARSAAAAGYFFAFVGEVVLASFAFLTL